MAEQSNSKGWQASVVRIVLAYAFFAGLWILVSDRAIGVLFRDPDSLLRAATFKGWVFVGATSVLLYGLLRRSWQRSIAELTARVHALQLLESIAESSEDAVFAKDTQGRYLLFNRAAGRFVGKSPSEVLGKDDRALFPPRQAEALIGFDRRVMESDGSITQEEALDTPAGERIFLVTKGPLHDADGAVIGLFGVSRDITERKQAELALRESEQRFHDIVRASADWTWEVDAQARYTYASDSVEDLLGYTTQEIVGKTPFDLMPPEEAQRVRTEFSAIAAKRQPFRDLDNINVHKDGSLRHVWTNGMPILDAEGELLGYRGLDRDITERKQAEAALLQLSNDLSATLQAIPDLLFELDEEGRYLQAEATAHNLLAAPVPQLLGHTVGEILPPDAARTVMDALAAAAKAGSDYGRTITLPLAEGPRHFELSVARKVESPGALQHFVLLSRDVTARQAAERELKERNAELERFDRAAVGREMRMIELKRQVNELSRQLGKEPPFDLSFEELPASDAGSPSA